MATVRTYLGDGLYASDDGYQIALEASDGFTTSNAVYLDDEVLLALVRFVERSRGVVITKDEWKEWEP